MRRWWWTRFVRGRRAVAGTMRLTVRALRMRRRDLGIRSGASPEYWRCTRKAALARSAGAKPSQATGPRDQNSRGRIQSDPQDLAEVRSAEAGVIAERSPLPAEQCKGRRRVDREDSRSGHMRRRLR